MSINKFKDILLKLIRKLINLKEDINIKFQIKMIFKLMMIKEINLLLRLPTKNNKMIKINNQ